MFQVDDKDEVSVGVFFHFPPPAYFLISLPLPPRVCPKVCNKHYAQCMRIYDKQLKMNVAAVLCILICLLVL